VSCINIDTRGSVDLYAAAVLPPEENNAFVYQSGWSVSQNWPGIGREDKNQCPSPPSPSGIDLRSSVLWQITLYFGSRTFCEAQDSGLKHGTLYFSSSNEVLKCCDMVCYLVGRVIFCLNKVRIIRCSFVYQVATSLSAPSDRVIECLRISFMF
jgi:hypothetical protein